MSSLREFRDLAGHRIRLGREFARGGEGSIHEVPGHPELVAKLYHKPPDRERQEKIAAMAHLGTERLRKLCAWPVSVILDLPSGGTRGFLMPRIEAHDELHVLYGPHSRMQSFPKADTGFLLRAATNLARAFEAVHEHGAVIGDVNDKIAMVGQDATIKLIDCDSFQVPGAGGRVFSCNVGVLTHQPPEMQGHSSFRGVRRSTNYDNFGLAVLLFQLLMLGRHPFSGTPFDNVDMPIEKAIRECRFVYASNAATKRMRPPPHALSLSALPQEVASLFERAFSEAGRDGQRPGAREWIGTLEGYEKSLKRCQRNPMHGYGSAQRSCPICAIEIGASVSLFLSAQTRVSAGTRVNLDPIMREILGIKGPADDDTRALPTIDAFTGARPLDAYRKFAAAGAATAALVFAGATGGWSLTLVLLAFILWPRVKGAEFNKRQQALREARGAYHAIMKIYEKEATADRFEKARAAIIEAKRKHDGLDDERRRRLDELQRKKRQLQLEAHLERHLVRRVKIRGVGPTKKTALLSHNIETALDVVEHKVRAVPGFGPALTKSLMDWRRAVERTFVFDASKAVDPRMVARVEQEMLSKRTALVQQIVEGPSYLRGLNDAIDAARRRIRPQIEAAARAVRDADSALKQL